MWHLQNALTFGIVTSMLVAQTILRNVAVEIGNAFALWFFSVVDFFPFLLCTILYYNKDLVSSLSVALLFSWPSLHSSCVSFDCC